MLNTATTTSHLGPFAGQVPQIPLVALFLAETHTK